MDAQAVAMIYSYTAVGVGIILAAAGLGSALGWGMICSKFIEGIARQPERVRVRRHRPRVAQDGG